MQSKITWGWLLGLIAGLVVEGVWLFLAFSIAGLSLPFFGLVGLWLLIVLSLFCFERLPVLCVAATWVNFVGCALIKTTPTNVGHRLLFFFRMHSVDIAMILFAHLAFTTRSQLAARSARQPFP